MKRTISLLMCMAFALLLTAVAQSITHTFSDVSMSDALKYLQQHTSRYKIVFIYDDLEDYKVTTTVKNKSVPDAIRQMIGFYPIKMTRKENREIYVEAILKTERRLKGVVVDEHNLPMPYANVTLLSPADSTMVGGGVTNESGRFVIPIEYGKVIARVSYVGYKTAYRLCSRDNVGTIKMHPDITALKETVVTAAKMQIERDGANYTLRNLGGTIMGNAGNALDLLRWTPGVIVGMNEDISLIGRDGKTEVYLNDRRVTNNAELKAVTSQNIKRVEIIREPDAQYASNVAAVVKLYTHSPYKDNLGASLMNVLDIKHKKSNTTTVTIDGKRDKLSGNASFSYGHLNTVAFTQGLTEIAGNGIEPWSYTKTDSTSYQSSGDDFQFFAGLNYAFTPRSVFGLQFNGNYRKLNLDQFSRLKTAQYLHGFTITEDIIKRNSTSASYLWQRNDHSQLLLIADYATSRQRDDQNLYEYIKPTLNPGGESSTIIKQYFIVDTNDYDIVTASAKYDFVSDGWKNHTGLEWGYTASNAIVHQNDLTQTSKRDNDWLGVYYTLAKTWGRWRLNAGLRYEYDHTRTDSKGFVLNKTYHNVLPSASVGFKPSHDVDLVLYYGRILRRPTYNELRPTSYYINTYQETTGNPLLQPSVTHRLALNANYKGFTSSLSYRLMDNAIQRIVEYMPSGIISEHPINIKHSHAWSLDLGYNYSNSWVNLGVQSSMTLPHITYPYLDGTRIEDRPYAVLSLNAQFTVARKFLLGCNALYSTPWTRGFTRNSSILGVNLSAMASLFKNRLLLGVTANDIFRRSTPSWSETRYMNAHNETYSYNYTRGVSLMVRWTFNSISNPFKKRSGNDAPLRRTQDN